MNSTAMIYLGVIAAALTFSAVIATEGCGGNFSQQTGTLQSPNYPNEYDNNQRCEWNIEVPSGQVAIQATSFNVEYDRLCRFDSLEVWDAVENTRLGKYCGHDTFAVLAPSNKLKLVFETDESAAGSGFSLTWNTVTECGGNYVQDSGILLSPNHPENYDNNERCTWDIALKTGKIMLIDVPVFNLEEQSTCNYDVLEVYDQASDAKLGSYCGSEPFSLLANTSAVRIKFKTDGSVTRTGFALKWKELQNECGGNFTQETGRITSPNYLQNYESDLNCVWVLSLPRSGSIHISVPHMDLETQASCSYDSVEVFDAATETSLGEGKYCGTETFELTTTVSSVKVVFKTDHLGSGGGFQLNWRDSTN